MWWRIVIYLFFFPCYRGVSAANGANCIYLMMAVTPSARCMFVPSTWRDWTGRPITRRSFCPEIVTDGATPQRYCAFTPKELVSNKDKSFAYIRCLYLSFPLFRARARYSDREERYVHERKSGSHVIVYRVLFCTLQLSIPAKISSWMAIKSKIG